MSVLDIDTSKHKPSSIRYKTYRFFYLADISSVELKKSFQVFGFHNGASFYYRRQLLHLCLKFVNNFTHATHACCTFVLWTFDKIDSSKCSQCIINVYEIGIFT